MLRAVAALNDSNEPHPPDNLNELLGEWPSAYPVAASVCAGDPFHYMDRAKVPVRHDAKKAFKVAFGDAFFVYEPVKLKEVEAVWKAKVNKSNCPLAWPSHHPFHYITSLQCSHHTCMLMLPPALPLTLAHHAHARPPVLTPYSRQPRCPLLFALAPAARLLLPSVALAAPTAPLLLRPPRRLLLFSPARRRAVRCSFLRSPRRPMLFSNPTTLPLLSIISHPCLRMDCLGQNGGGD
jgi:hypothetical protein